MIGYPTEEEVNEFIESLVHNRFTKRELEKKLQKYFNVENTLKSSTTLDCKDVDYSFLFTNEIDESEHFCDVEIYYLKMRNGHIFVTEVALLEYC